jgi:TolA-binding protein
LSEELKGSERELRYVERVQVKGRQKSLELYTFFEDGYVPNEPYTMALREFQSGNFGTAEMLFIQFLFDYPNDPGVKHVLSHLHVVMRGEVKNWEGTWRFSDKY